MKFVRAALHSVAAFGFIWMAVDEILAAARSVHDPWDRALKSENERVKADVGEVKES